MRLLAVIGTELMGADDRDDWAVLNALVAANGPDHVEVRVLALVNGPGHAIVVGSPLGRAVGAMPRWNAVPSGFYNPAESARGRLDRALQYLRRLGVRATGDIGDGRPYRAVVTEVCRGDYHRVLLLVGQGETLSTRLARRSLAPRLRRALDIPVEVPGRATLRPPG